MNAKTKIEKYVKEITKNETYVDYLTKAAEFGYGLGKKEAEAEIKELKDTLTAYEDLGLSDSNGFFDDEY
jgi:Uri superfamily endonuclease